MHPLCVCMSTSQELCWWQMVMSAQKVLFFSGFLAVDCFLKSILFNNKDEKCILLFCQLQYPRLCLGSKLYELLVPYPIMCLQGRIAWHTKQSSETMLVYVYIWRIHHNMTNQCENFLRFVDDESNIFLQSKFHASAALRRWNSWKLYVFIYTNKYIYIQAWQMNTQKLLRRKCLYWLCFAGLITTFFLIIW